MPETLLKEKDFLPKTIKANYAKLIGVELADVQPDSLTLQMPLNAEDYSNVAGFVHGGVIMSLADTAMGSACFKLGNTVTTLDLNINFIKSVKPTGIMKAVAKVIHNGSRTMVAEAELYDNNGAFVAKARGTFFVTGKAADLELFK